MLVAILAVPIVMSFGDFNSVYNGSFGLNEAGEAIKAFGSNPFAASWQEIVTGLAWGLGYFGMPHIIVRFMGIEKPSMVKKSATVAITWVVLSLGAAIAIAVLGRTYIMPNGISLAGSLLSTGSQESIFITVVQEIFPGFIAGLLLAAIVAAAMSTADSQLLVASSAFTSDLYKPMIRKDKASDGELLWVGRIVVVIVAVIAFVIAALGETGEASWATSIMNLVSNAWGLFGAAFGPVVILSLFWRRMNYAGACAGIIAGAVVDIVWLVTLTSSTGVYELLPGFIAGFIATVLVSLATKAPDQKVLAIYESATDASIDD